ncbi:MAG TPA: ThuA domain-containing protein [Kiritimatiellia bacterium]|nr:ThuA domain-containing protein [Kiritimatiellia bacterium]
MTTPLRITIWNEYQHERENPGVQRIYPDGIHTTIANGLRAYPGLHLQTATLDQPEHGLTEAVLDATDVLVWWGHKAHNKVSEDIVKRVQKKVLEGMGLIVLHSGHYSRIFRALMGTTCSLKWREAAEKERIWNLAPAHPITQGIGDFIEIQHEEMYGERFDIPEPDELIFVSWFQGGEVFRSGCCWTRGHGRIFYFRPGHETYPTYHHPDVSRVIANAARWATPRKLIPDTCPNVPPLEPLPPPPKEYHSAGLIQTADDL